MAIVGLILLVESTSVGLNALYAGQQQSGALFEMGRHIVRETSLVAAVAVASRLYVFWRNPSLDRRDARRFTALAMLAFGLTISSIARWTIWMLTPPMVGLVPLPYALFSGILIFTSSLVINAGAVFLFGSVVIALLRRAQVESRLVWTTAGSIGAMLCYLLVQHGSAILAYLLADPTLRLIPIPQVVQCVVVGILGGPLYLLIVDPEAIQKTFANLPSLIRSLRSWPYRPPESE